jgi:hypothetical protein
MDDAVWDVTVFTKNRERLIAGAISQQLLESVLVAARASLAWQVNKLAIVHCSYNLHRQLECSELQICGVPPIRLQKGEWMGMELLSERKRRRPDQ